MKKNIIFILLSTALIINAKDYQKKIVTKEIKVIKKEEIIENDFIRLRRKMYSNDKEKEFKYFSRWHNYLKELEEEKQREELHKLKELEYQEEVDRVNEENRKIKEYNEKLEYEQQQQQYQYQNQQQTQQQVQPVPQQNTNGGTVAPQGNTIDASQISYLDNKNLNLANLEDSKYRLKVSAFKPMTVEQSKNYSVFSKASWYGNAENGTATASGEIYNENMISAAHKTLPLGTIVKVTNLQNNRFVVTKINDRGPYVPNREIDLSKGAFQLIANVNQGVVPVKIEVIKTKNNNFI